MIDGLDIRHQPMRPCAGIKPGSLDLPAKLSVADNIMAVLETAKDLERRITPQGATRACCKVYRISRQHQRIPSVVGTAAWKLLAPWRPPQFICSTNPAARWYLSPWRHPSRSILPPGQRVSA